MRWPDLKGRASRLPGVAVRIKRWLFLFHRWLGVGMCLLFVMWPLTGVVMMYVPFPELTENERHAGLPVLDAGQIRAGPAELLQRAAPDASRINLVSYTCTNRPAAGAIDFQKPGTTMALQWTAYTGFQCSDLSPASLGYPAYPAVRRCRNIFADVHYHCLATSEDKSLNFLVITRASPRNDAPRSSSVDRSSDIRK